VLAVAVIAVLTGLAVTGAVSAGMVAGSIWMLILFLATVIVVGLLTLPKLLDYFASFDNDELLIVPLVGICFGVSLLALHAGLSMALGAVLIGAIASESRAVQRSHKLIAPLRHVFSAVFFVAIGLMLEPAMLLKYWAPVLIVTGAVIVGKFTINTISALLTGHDVSTAIRAGAGLAQIGEFAFIIAALGISLGATGDPVYQIGVTAAIITTMLNPYLLHGADKLAQAIDRSPSCRRWTLCFQLYGEWAQRIKTSKQDDAIRKVIRRSLILIIVNTILIVSAIACAGYLAKPQKLLIPALAEYPDMVPAILWLMAILLCLPLYIAAIRKFGALGMLLAEMSFPIELNTSWARHMRSFISNAILMSGSLALLLMTFALSSAILQSVWVLMLLMVITAGIGLWQRPKMIKVYSQAQLAIQSVFSSDQNLPQTHASTARTLEHEHMDMNVKSMSVPDKSMALGLSLRDMELRTKTGATLVGIQRKNRRIVNPGPDDVIMPGDRLFILGTPQQIQSVSDMLTGSGK
jgi:CPA2 family monovalent cation:H+ antiporter-2